MSIACTRAGRESLLKPSFNRLSVSKIYKKQKKRSMKLDRNTKVIIFCGIPGCGKSTIARLLAKELEKRGSVTLFVSDDIRGRIYKKIPRILTENAGIADFLILDATFYKEKWRQMVYALAKPHPVFLVYVWCKKETAIKRNKKRKPGIPEKVIHIMASQFETPKTPSIAINTGRIQPNVATQKILKKIVQSKNSSQKILQSKDSSQKILSKDTGQNR